MRVTNNSYGGDGYSQAEFDAISTLNDSGILFVAAAGNESEDNNTVPAYPATYDLPNVISVAALDRTDKLASFSNRGSRTVHLGAPGAAILSTTPNNTYSYFDGTSMASPHVAGTAALVLAAHPEFSVARLRASLLFGGDSVQALDATTITGRRLSAAGALLNATDNDNTPPGPISDLHLTSQTDRTVALAWTTPADDGQTGKRASLTEIFFTDAAGGARLLLDVQRPDAPGTTQAAVVNIPFRHTSGTLTVRVTDNAGNTTNASVNVADTTDVADLYTVTTGAPAALSTGGAALPMQFNDIFSNYQLPFTFPFFERYATSVNLSTNGAIYIGNAPARDYNSLHETLGARNMIAVLWQDLDLRSRRADSTVYVVQPDQDRIIFRWQGVTFEEGTPVNFELELRRDGTIIKRYGDGNTNVHPVVGIGGGEPEPYVLATHTSEAAPIN
ncbi:MAG TPA: S8 family serine peptidase, partial [Pyrinomonadaceae bacterium]|nr:S8 family serine peptidase [Pyrinomonadaceae bacterium]